ncbi:BON domain-containing protein [Geotalea sp. SG265]|uniref:BON domain-containing protein n=1 Tax=Geotalea sp. SG265 TaxID=2922867 RepID=UPI001FAEF7D8|nr:BON domain-containing protein [Geotalea sp. SG265]
MDSRIDIARDVLAAFEREPLINLHANPIKIEYANGAVTLTGETESLAAKKIALEVAGKVPGVTGIIDRLHVKPAEPMEDGEIRTHVCNAIMAETMLEPYALRALVKGEMESIRESLNPSGVIEVEVADGVVTLNGQVASLSQKRMAGVLAWWVPGSRDVINGLEIAPPEEDTDDEVVDAVRLALEKDPFVNATQIRVRCRNYLVTLEGLVTTETERRMAEADAWYVFRVDGVKNLLQHQ